METEDFFLEARITGSIVTLTRQIMSTGYKSSRDTKAGYSEEYQINMSCVAFKNGQMG
jgi:hypothetical protein